MAIQIQTSFISPKTPAVLSVPRAMGGRRVNLFFFFALLVFFGVLGLSVTVFFYKSRLIETITRLDASLIQAKKSFDPEFVAEVSRLRARIEGAKELLLSHRALSPLFDILEEKTLKSVRFQNFHFSAGNGRDITIGMIGEAKSFNSIALQSDVFGVERSFKDPVFSDFSLDESGNVIFNFKTAIDPKLLLYRETLLGTASGKDTAGGAQDADSQSNN